MFTSWIHRTYKRAMQMTHARNLPGTRTLLLLSTGAIFCLGLSLDDAQAANRRGSTEDATPLLAVSEDQVETIWSRIVPQYTRRMAEIEGKLVACPGYDPRLPSSFGKTVREVQASEKIVIRQEIAPGIYRNVEIPLSIDEAQAEAMPLPALKPGEYGFIHSAKIDEILGEDEMILTDVWLIDEDTLEKQISIDRRQLSSQRTDPDQIKKQLEAKYGKRMKLMDRQDGRDFKSAVIRLKGFATRGFKQGDRWDGDRRGSGVQIAIVASEKEGAGRRVKETLLAVPTSFFGKPLDEAKFEAYLAEREFTRERFAALVAAENERDRDLAMRRVFAALDKAREKVEEIEAVEAKAQEMIEEQQRRAERGR